MTSLEPEPTLFAAQDDLPDMETGPPVESLEDYDDMLEEWANLMDSGDYAGVLTMLEKRLAHVEGLPPLDEILSGVRAFAHLPVKCRCFTSHNASLTMDASWRAA